MENMIEKINEAVAFIQDRVRVKPQYGIILGTGLGALAKEIDVQAQLDYATIPYFPVSTVESHKGRLIFGTLSGKQVVVMQGRFHYYEGYTMQQITFPIRVMKFLGIEKLFISNAAGGINPEMQIGDLMILNDHINLLPSNPLIGKNYDEIGPRFPDMSEPYDRGLVEKALTIAKQLRIRCLAGVYASVPGPCLETKAEYRYLRTIGADAVGMSTVPEVIVANHMGVSCFAISVITDIGYPPERVKRVSLEDVIAAANEAEPRMTALLKELIAQT